MPIRPFVPFACLALLAALAGAGQEMDLEGFELLETVPLQAPLDHVQGIEFDAGRLWVTSVDRAARKGRLHLFDIPAGTSPRSVEIQRDELYHPGGICADGETLWIPVAAYHRAGPSIIERRAKETLELLGEFPTEDHIGCIAAEDSRLIGANWDARRFHVWDKSGKLLSTRENPFPSRYQDMKIVSGRLVASGILGRGAGSVGVIDWLNPSDMTLERRVRGGRTDRGVIYMNEGMAILGDRLLLLPEDGPSRLFVFRMAW